MDRSEIGFSDCFYDFGAYLWVFQHFDHLVYGVCQKIGRSDKLEEHEMFEGEDQCGKKVKHCAEAPGMKETDLSADVLFVSFCQIIGDERNCQCKHYIYNV